MTHFFSLIFILIESIIHKLFLHENYQSVTHCFEVTLKLENFCFNLQNLHGLKN